MTITVEGPTIRIETRKLKAEIQTEGYTTGVRAGTLLDKQTGAHDLGFGLDIVDFLLEPGHPPAENPRGGGAPDQQYPLGNLVHGHIPKRYVEGPQICTQAKKVSFEAIAGQGFVAVRQWYRWNHGYPPYQGGSWWVQTLIFPDNTRYFLAADQVTTVNAVPSEFLRIDMPGHIKHTGGDQFSHVYLSYYGTIPATEFTRDFPPDAKFRYRRGAMPMPRRFIRAYQVRRPGDRGPWLAGMTLNPPDVYEAWCHQRGYVCLIEEIGGRPTRPGDTFGAAYIVGWFDDVAAMERTYDKHRGWSGLELTGPAHHPTGFRGVPQAELKPAKKVIGLSSKALVSRHLINSL